MKVMRYLEQKAQGMVEYALLLAFVVGIAATVLTASSEQGLGGAIQSVFTKVENQLKGTNNNGQQN